MGSAVLTENTFYLHRGAQSAEAAAGRFISLKFNFEKFNFSPSEKKVGTLLNIFIINFSKWSGLVHSIYTQLVLFYRPDPFLTFADVKCFIKINECAKNTKKIHRERKLSIFSRQLI